MNESIMSEQIAEEYAPAIPKAFNTIVYGGLTVGTLDAVAACINAANRGVPPDRVFQYISSALLGRETAYAGGFATILIGVLMHYCVAFGVATTFYLISSRVPTLLRHAVLVGMVYGVAVYFIMGYLIVPLTRVTQGSATLSGTLIGISIHMFCVGLPPALWAKRSARQT
jgi:hypothetical protein